MSRLFLERKAPAAAFFNASKRWVSSAGIWGASAGAAGLLLLSVTPLVKREVLVNVPVLGSYYEDKTPASDKPF